MKTTHLYSSWTRMAIILLLIGALAATSCSKDKSGGFGNAPRKEVPDPFVGTFMYVTTTGGYVDQFGHYVDAVAQGVSLHIDQNGTGSSHYFARVSDYSGRQTTDEVKTQCTFEITKTSETTANIIIHYVSGKNYHNGALRHDLDASLLYPNGDTVWNDCEIGTNSEGKTYFVARSVEGYTSQFTKQ